MFGSHAAGLLTWAATAFGSETMTIGERNNKRSIGDITINQGHSPEAKRKNQDTTPAYGICSTIAAAHYALARYPTDQSKQTEFLTEFGFSIQDLRESLHILIKDKVRKFNFQNSTDSTKRNIKLTELFTSVINFDKCVSWSLGDSETRLQQVLTSEMFTARTRTVTYHVNDMQKVYSDKLWKTMLNILKVFNPQTDSTSVFCFDQEWLSKNQGKIQLCTAKKLNKAKAALNLETALSTAMQKVIEQSEQRLTTAIQTMTKKQEEMETNFQQQLSEMEEKLREKFEEKFENQAEAVVSQMAAYCEKEQQNQEPEKEPRSRSRSVRLQVPDQKNDPKPQQEKNTRGWETPSRRKRGRSTTRRNQAKKFVVRPKETEGEKDTKVDTKYAQKKSIAAILTVKSDVTIEEIKEWFKTSSTVGFDATKVTIEYMTKTRAGFLRFKVLITDFPIQGLSFMQIWNSFKIPIFVEILEWRGNPTQSAKATTKRISFYIGNLNPETDFSQKLKDRAKEVYNQEGDDVTVVKLNPPKDLKPGEKQRASAYCLVVHRKETSDMTDAQEKAPEQIPDLLTEHLQAKAAGIRIHLWKGRPLLPGNAQRANNGPVQLL